MKQFRLTIEELLINSLFPFDREEVKTLLLTNKSKQPYRFQHKTFKEGEYVGSNRK